MKKALIIIPMVLLALLTLLSLALNGVVIYSLIKARQITLAAVGDGQVTLADARAIVTGAADDTFSYTIELEQEFPVTVSVPIDEEVTVPIKTTVPINTTVVVPIDLGVTTYDLQVPIQTVFPVDLAFTVPVSHTVDINTTVPIDVDVPIEIPIAETPLVDYLEQVEAALTGLEQGLARLEANLADPFGTEK
jgi:hypothetical protein